MQLLPGDPPYPQLLELQLLVTRVQLIDLYWENDFSDSENNYYKLPGTIQVLTCLDRLQLIFQALDSLFELISLLCMLSGGYIEFILHSKSLINALGNLCIFLSKELSVV
jgi:hypothetical protein